MLYVVIHAHLIETAEEAHNYYRQKLAGSHAIHCAGRPVTIVFERDSTHVYTDEKADPAGGMVSRRLPSGKDDTRPFSLSRARLMDEILRAVSLSTVSLRVENGRRLVYGRALPDGRYMRVVLRPGPGAAFTCVSAYPVELAAWMDAKRSRAARFPP